MNRSATRAVVVGGAIAGVLDEIFAVVAYVYVLKAYSIVGVLQYIASGALGSAAFAGGLATAALGVGIHFAIAFAFGTLYVVAARSAPALREHDLLFGALYGAAIWCLMDLVVLPHSGTPQAPLRATVFASFLIDHALFVGLPIALAARRYAPQNVLQSA